MSVPAPPSNVIRQPNRGFHMFHISEIYAPGGMGLYVPNVNDLIVDYSAGFYRCVEVDYTTAISRLERWDIPRSNLDVGDQDILLGAGPGRASESYRAYLDTSVTPHILALDSRLKLYGSTNRYVKLFRGSEISETRGEVVSMYYNASGELLGDNIPLELVALEGDGSTNIAIQTPSVGYTLTQMQDGEVVSVVVYDDAGNVRSVSAVTVKNTSFIRGVDQSIEYIVDISIESPYLSSADPTTLEVPINMPVVNLPIIGVVTYNSGRTVKLPIDRNKFQILGMDNYIATRAGQTVDVALSYRLAHGEHSYGMNVSTNNHITKPYKIRTAAPNLSYAVKLYAYPEWVDAITGYRLKFFLTNLERNYMWDVTSHVTAGTGSRAFNPTEYGILQRVSFMVNLANVDPRFNAYHHVETFEFNLVGPPNNQDLTAWLIGYEPNQDPKYGLETTARIEFESVGNWSVDLASGATSLEEWLELVYYRTIPLYNQSTEARAPIPTHFYLSVGNSRALFPISQFGLTHRMESTVETGQCVYLEFIRRLPNNDLQLSVAAMPVRRV